jgi:hypothetical protein
MRWQCMTDDERGSWDFTPTESVGPLRFGMSHDDVSAELRHSMVATSGVFREGDRAEWVDFALRGGNSVRVPVALTAYYDGGGLLAGVALDARSGPQVRLDEIRMVGRFPSELDEDLSAYASSHGLDVMYSQRWDPSLSSQGVVVRGQRVDDVVLTRPVFVGPAWMADFGDIGAGAIPMSEWDRF